MKSERRKAESMIAEAANQPDMIGHAKHQADATLKEFHRQLGWDLEIHWKWPSVARERSDGA